MESEAASTPTLNADWHPIRQGTAIAVMAEQAARGICPEDVAVVPVQPPPVSPLRSPSDTGITPRYSTGSPAWSAATGTRMGGRMILRAYHQRTNIYWTASGRPGFLDLPTPLSTRGSSRGVVR